MNKQIKITFEKGGALIANLLEDKAPITCKIMWDALEKPLHDWVLNTNICSHMLETPYLPIPENAVIPNENLWHYSKDGDIATISPAEYREYSIEGYAPFTICWNVTGKLSNPHIALHGAPMVFIQGGDSIKQKYMKNLMETCRANVWARVREEDFDTMFEVGCRIRFHGIEGVNVERIES